MRAGKLDRIIRIDRYRAGEPNQYGTSTSGWESLATLRAQVVQADTEEFLRAAGVSEETAIIFRTRWLAGITTADRVVYQGSAFDLKEVKEIGRGNGLELRAMRSEG